MNITTQLLIILIIISSIAIIGLSFFLFQETSHQSKIMLKRKKDDTNPNDIHHTFVPFYAKHDGQSLIFDESEESEEDNFTDCPPENKCNDKNTFCGPGSVCNKEPGQKGPGCCVEGEFIKAVKGPSGQVKYTVVDEEALNNNLETQQSHSSNMYNYDYDYDYDYDYEMDIPNQSTSA